MADKKKQPKNKLLEEDFLDTNTLSATQLSQRLEEMHQYLLKRDTEPSGDEPKDEGDETKRLTELKYVARNLLQTSILKHKDEAIRLTAACCLADIIRIYAPNSPYDEDQTQALFKLFIQQLGALDNMNNPNANKVAYLLERLAVVKAFVLVVHFEDLKLKLFGQLFRAVRSEHPKMIVIHMIDILVSTIDESESISQDLISLILRHLRQEEENTSASMLAKTVIYRCAEKLHLPISEFLAGILTNTDNDVELRESHALIFELHGINPNLISSSLPQLETELSSETTDVRSTAVQLLSAIFSAKDSSLSVNNKQLYTAFLQRFKDFNVGIREVMVEFAASFIVNQAHSKLADQVIGELKLRLLDPNEKIRTLAVEAISSCALETPERISPVVLQEVGNRMRDKKPEVREAAMEGLAKLFKALIDKWGVTTEWTKDQIKSYAWIPNKLFSLFSCLIQPEDRNHVEEVIHEYLMPNDKASRTIRLFIDMLSTFDENALKALSYLFQEKKMDEFRSYLEARDGDDAEKTKQKAAIITKRLGADGFKTIHKMADKKIFSQLALLVDVKAEEATVAQAKSPLKKDAKKKEHLKNLIRKLTFGEFGTKHMNYLFKHVHFFSKNEVDGLQGLLKVLEDFASAFPNFFASSIEKFPDLLGSSDDLVINSTLQILSNVGPLFTDNSQTKPLKDLLTDICSTGTSDQTQKAIRAIITIFKPTQARPIIGKVTQALWEQAQNDIRPAAFEGLNVLCGLEINSTFNTLADDIIEFVMKTLLPKQPKKKKSAHSVQQSELCSAKLAGIKIVCSYLLSEENNQEDLARSFMTILFQFIQGKGATLLIDDEMDVENDITNEIDREYIRSAAVTSLLRLAERHDYDRLFEITEFQKLAQTTHDPSAEVRTDILNQLFEGLKVVGRKKHSLPLRYMAFLVLYATDPERELLLKAKKSLLQVIHIRRELIKVVPPTENASMSPLLPENALPYLIHLLAHLDNFHEETPHFRNTHRYLSFFFEPLLQHADNSPFLHDMLHFIKQTNDVQDPEDTGIHVVTDLALLVLQQRMDRKTFRKHPGVVYLPQNLFKQKENNEATENVSYLPSGFQLQKKTLFGQFMMETGEEKAKKKGRKAKAAENASASSSSSEEEPMDLDKPSPKKAGKKAQATKLVSPNQSPEKSPQGKKATKAPAKAAKGAKAPKAAAKAPKAAAKTPKAAAKAPKAATKAPKSPKAAAKAAKAPKSPKSPAAKRPRADSSKKQPAKKKQKVA